MSKRGSQEEIQTESEIRIEWPGCGRSVGDKAQCFWEKQFHGKRRGIAFVECLLYARHCASYFL